MTEVMDVGCEQSVADQRDLIAIVCSLDCNITTAIMICCHHSMPQPNAEHHSVVTAPSLFKLASLNAVSVVNISLL
jgi:hypothetical protein